MLLYTHNYPQTYKPKKLQLQRTHTNTLTEGKRAEEVKSATNVPTIYIPRLKKWPTNKKYWDQVTKDINWAPMINLGDARLFSCFHRFAFLFHTNITICMSMYYRLFAAMLFFEESKSPVTLSRLSLSRRRPSGGANILFPIQSGTGVCCLGDLGPLHSSGSFKSRLTVLRFWHENLITFYTFWKQFDDDFLLG